jgi:hypothetical protein
MTLQFENKIRPRPEGLPMLELTKRNPDLYWPEFLLKKGLGARLKVKL